MHLITFLKQFPKFKLQKINFYEEAFCHRSYVNEHPEALDYEKLEFFGDSIIGFTVALFLYRRKLAFKDLTVVKNYLISGQILAKVAKNLSLQDYILGSKDMMKKGFNDSILADVFEAFVAAIFLDSGIKIVQNFILKYLIKPFYEEAIINIDYRTKLQECCQKKTKELPTYSFESINHHKFIVICKYQNFNTQVEGINKKNIATKAAYLMLKKLKIL